MPILVDPVNQRSSTAIVGEAHVVGEDVVDEVWLDELPDPAIAVAITGFTQIAAGAPAVGQFRCDYENGRLAFNNADAGASVAVDYNGTGSGLDAADIARIHSKLQGEKVITFSATPSLDFDDEWANVITLTGNATVDVAKFPPAGAVCTVRVIQDATGSRTVTWDPTDFDGGSEGFPTLTTIASRFDLLTFLSTGSKLHLLGSALGFTP